MTTRQGTTRQATTRQGTTSAGASKGSSAKTSSRGATLRLSEANPLVTIQDAGRRGAMRYGVSQSGPMDWVRHAQALALVDAPAAFEVGLAGAVFEVEGTARLSLTGPGFLADVGETHLEAPAVFTVSDAAVRITTRGGVWGYLAATHLDLGAPVLGSHAMNARTGMGSRDLSAAIPCAGVSAEAAQLYEDALKDDDAPLGLLPGPQVHLFGEEARATLTDAAFRLSSQLDRMGYRLEGPPLRAKTHDIISDGIVEGAMQVPGSGQPIVLCADRQPTGGYPKVAILAAADRPRLTQRRPGDTVHFRWMSLDEAHAARRALAEAARNPVARTRQRVGHAELAGENLISGVWG